MVATFTEVADGLEFPEGPVARPDGSVLVVEMFGERISRIDASGKIETVADVAGGPNGLAVGPDGALYLCNNGRSYTPLEFGGLTLPGPFDPDRYIGGRIQRVDSDGTVADLYNECDGRPLRSPNDLVMDGHGGFYFTDHGIYDARGARSADLTAIHYARCDGSAIRQIVFPAHSPNGIGLSPDGSILYFAETYTGRVFRRRILEPGVVERTSVLANPWALLCGLPGNQLLDSLAVDGDGWVCVATMIEAGGITSISPDGATIEHVATGDPLTTNLCFGGEDRCIAYITLSGTGRLVSTAWPRARLHLAHQ